MSLAQPTFSKRKTLLFSALIIGLLLAMAEVASWFIISRYSDTGSFSSRKIENPFHPLYGWEPAADYRVNVTKFDGPEGFVTTDHQGHPITPLHYDHPTLTVAVTGGSAMFGVGSTGNATTVPAILEKKIHDQLGLDVEVINLAVRGHTSYQEMLRLREWLLHNHADLVLTVSGHNDAFAGRNASDMLFTLINEQIWRNATPLVRSAETQQPIILNPLGLIRRYSHFADLIARVALRATGGNPIEFYAGDNTKRQSSAPRLDVEELAASAAANYRMMDSLSRSYDSAFVLMLQPTAYTLDRYPADISYFTRNLEQAATERSHEVAFNASLLRRMGNPRMVSLEQALDGTTGPVYVDNCHYTDAGADRVAQVILDEITTTLRTLAARK